MAPDEPPRGGSVGRDAGPADVDAAAPSSEATRQEMPALTVQIVHGALDEASYPLLIGHATGTPISGAESRCDDLLGGALRTCSCSASTPTGRGSRVTYGARCPSSASTAVSSSVSTAPSGS